MKKIKKFTFLFLILIIAILSFTIYSSVANDKTSDIKEKTLSEIKYFESKIINIFNSLNNIEFENYKISTEDISNKSKGSGENSSGGNNSSSEDTSSSSGDSKSSSNSDSSSTSSNNNTVNNTKKYSLNTKGVLTSKQDINWEYIKNEAEILNSSLSTMTLDLYEISLNSNDIVTFNKEYSNLLIEIKNENKENTLAKLTTLYSYIPKFIKNCSNDEQYKIIINTKDNIFNAYSLLDTDNWNTINEHLIKANETFSKLLTDINLQNKNQYTINKCYILLNDLQNTVNNKDKEIFLIKYKNLLEELNNI